MLLLLSCGRQEEGRYTAAVEARVETDADIRVLSGRSTEEIAETMHVAPASVYTMKYRIKKKYPESFPLPF